MDCNCNKNNLQTIEVKTDNKLLWFISIVVLITLIIVITD